MTTREIETYITELYGPGVGRDTVSRVTAGVLDDVKAWQTLRSRGGVIPTGPWSVNINAA